MLLDYVIAYVRENVDRDDAIRYLQRGERYLFDLDAHKREFWNSFDVAIEDATNFPPPISDLIMTFTPWKMVQGQFVRVVVDHLTYGLDLIQTSGLVDCIGSEFEQQVLGGLGSVRFCFTGIANPALKLQVDDCRKKL